VLAQQILLAQLAVTEGRPAAGTAIAREVSRWAGALGLVLYQRHADAVVADAASALTGEAGAHPAGTADLLPAGAEDLLPAGEDDRS
jgi:hypothetical protein